MMRKVWLLSILVWLTAALPGGAAEEPAVESEEEIEIPNDLSKEDAATLREFCGKSSVQWLKNNEANLKASVTKFFESNHLTSEEQEKMLAVLPAVSGELGTRWADKLEQMLQQSVLNSGARVIAQWKPEQFSESYAGYFHLSFQDTAAWKEALKQTLQPDKMAALEEAAKVRREKVLEKMKESLGACEDMVKQRLTQLMDGRARRVTQNSEIDEERVKLLTKAADEAVKAAVVAWRSQAEATVSGMTETELKNLRKSIQEQRMDPWFLRSEKDITQPHEQPAWKEALATILTAEERKLFAERRREYRQRRAATLALTIVTELDPLFGFSEAQRAALTEAGAREMQGLPAFYFEPPDPNTYYGMNLQNLLARVQQIDAKWLEQTLEAGQFERWKTLKPEMLPQGNYYREPVPVDEKAVAPANELEAEQMISDVLYSQSHAIRQRELNIMAAKVEIIARVTKLGPEGRTVLMTAAKGASERTAQNTFTQAEQYLRQQFQNTPFKNLQERLVNFSMPNFGNRGREPESPIWKAAIERVLDAPQKQAWQEDCESRSAWRLRTMAASGVSDLEQQMKLKPEQVEKLQKKVEAIIKDYEPELENYFSAGWYLQGHYNKVPVALLSEEEMKEIFSKEEVETLKDRCIPNALNYAENLKRNHSRRVQKEPAAKK